MKLVKESINENMRRSRADEENMLENLGISEDQLGSGAGVYDALLKMATAIIQLEEELLDVKMR